MKKIITLLCLAAMLINTVSMSMAAELSDTVAQKLAVLNGIGISLAESVDKDDYIYSLAGFLYDDAQNTGTAEEIARRIGIIEAGEVYESGKLTYQEAAKYAVITLGYKPFAEQKGATDETYIELALQLGITKGVTLNNGRMTEENVITILYNMLGLEPLALEMGVKETYKVLTGETLLSKNRHIYEVEGLLTANRYTSIYGEGGTGDDTVIISDTEFYVSNSKMNDYLGYYITGYAAEDDKEYTLLYVETKENKNKILTLQDTQIYDVATDYSYIEYENESGRSKQAKLEAVPRVIFNGMYYTGYTREDLMPDVGNVVLIDNNGNGKYDIVYVTSYETIIVSAVNTSDMKIMSKCIYNGAIEELDLSADGGDTYYTIRDGEYDGELSDLKVGQVLSVAKTKGPGEKKVEIIISNNEKISGKITGKYVEERLIMVDGEKYRYAQSVDKQVGKTGKKFEVGSAYIFCVDAFGNIVYLEDALEQGYKLFHKIKYNQDEEKYYLDYMDMNEEWSRKPLAEKVMIDETRYTADVAFETLVDLEPQIMLIEENVRGEIRKIDTARVSANFMEEFTRTGEIVNTRYRSAPKCFDMKYWLEDDAKIVVIPEEYTSDRKAYYIMAAEDFFESDKVYTIDVYDIDEYNFTKLITSNVKPKRSSAMLLVRNLSSAYDPDEDSVYPSLVGSTATYDKITIMAKDSSVFSGITKGMLVRLTTDYNGYVSKCTVVTDLNNWAETGALTSTSYYTSDGIDIRGIVDYIDLEKGRIKVKHNGSSLVFKIRATGAVLKYYTTNNKCESKTVADLRPGDKVICSVSSGLSSGIVWVE